MVNKDTEEPQQALVSRDEKTTNGSRYVDR